MANVTQWFAWPWYDLWTKFNRFLIYHFL